MELILTEIQVLSPGTLYYGSNTRMGVGKSLTATNIDNSWKEKPLTPSLTAGKTQTLHIHRFDMIYKNYIVRYHELLLKTLCPMACIANFCFCFDSVAEESLRKIERIWGINGKLKYNLLVKTGIK